MKKIISIILIVALLLMTIVSFTGCEKKGTCESCGQQEVLKKYVDSDKETYWLCEYCYNMQKFIDTF